MKLNFTVYFLNACYISYCEQFIRVRFFFYVLTSMFNSSYNWTKIVPPHFSIPTTHFSIIHYTSMCHNKTEEKIWCYFCFIVKNCSIQFPPLTKFVFAFPYRSEIQLLLFIKQDKIIWMIYEWLKDLFNVILIEPIRLPNDIWHLSGLIIPIEEL